MPTTCLVCLNTDTTIEPSVPFCRSIHSCRRADSHTLYRRHPTRHRDRSAEAVSRSPIAVAAAVLTALAASCGSPDEADGPATSTLAPTGGLLDDLVIEVTGGPATNLCVEAAAPQLAIVMQERCLEPPHALVLDIAGGELVDIGDPDVNSATLLVSPYPLVVRSVSQRGAELQWKQSGRALLVLGRSFLAQATTVDFEIEGSDAHCQFGPQGSECVVGS